MWYYYISSYKMLTTWLQKAWYLTIYVCIYGDTHVHTYKHTHKIYIIQYMTITSSSYTTELTPLQWVQEFNHYIRQMSKKHQILCCLLFRSAWSFFMKLHTHTMMVPWACACFLFKVTTLKLSFTFDNPHMNATLKVFINLY